MFWLLVFTSLFLALLWRGTRLNHASGLLALAVLAYGWRGESTGRFVLMLLGFIAVMLPLNSKTLRQEWFARALLERLLPRLPRKPPAPGPGAGLLDASLAPLPLAAQPGSALDEQALQTILEERLRQPLQPFFASGAQATLASALYLHRAVGQHPCTLDANNDLGFARQTQAHASRQLALTLGAMGAEVPALDACPVPTAQLLQRLLGLHPSFGLVIASAEVDNAYQRLLQFDAAVFTALRLAMQRGARALIGALSLGRALPASASDDDEAQTQRLLALSALRLACLIDVGLAVEVWGNDETRQHAQLSWPQPLLAALYAQASAAAALQTLAESTHPHLERPLALLATQQALLAGEAAQWQLLQQIRRPLRRWGLAAVLFPLGRRMPSPAWPLQFAAVRAVVQHPEVCAQLIPPPGGLTVQSRLAQARALTQLEGTLSQLASAQGLQANTENSSDAERLQRAIQLGFVSPQAQAALEAAAGFAQTLSPPSISPFMEATRDA